MEIKDFSDAIIKVTSINDERIKAWDDFRKGMELCDKTSRILYIRDQYQAIANWLFWDELAKGYYTPEDRELGRSCLEGTTICNSELTAIGDKAIKDKVQSEILSILFHR